MLRAGAAVIDSADWQRWVQALRSTLAAATKSADPDVHKLRGEIVSVFDKFDMETINHPGHEEEWVTLRLVMSEGSKLAMLLKKERERAALAAARSAKASAAAKAPRKPRKVRPEGEIGDRQLYRRSKATRTTKTPQPK